MAIGRVNAPLGDYFVGDTIKPEHINIELDAGINMRQQDRNEYTTKREYSDGLVVGKDNYVYMLVDESFSNYIYKFDSKLNTVWVKKVENSRSGTLPDLYYNYHKNIMYIHQKERIIAISMNANVIKTIEHKGPFTWDDKGNMYLLSVNNRLLTVQKLNNSFVEEWSSSHLYNDTLSMSKVFYFSDGYIYVPNNKINVSNRVMEKSFDFLRGVTNDKQNVMCLTTTFGKSRVISNGIDYSFNSSIPTRAFDTYVSDKGEVMWLDGDVVFKVVNPGILVNVQSVAWGSDKVYNIAGNGDILYVAKAKGFSSTSVSDYGVILSYKTSKINNITITGRD